jgi:hypothetical protein
MLQANLDKLFSVTYYAVSYLIRTQKIDLSADLRNVHSGTSRSLLRRNANDVQEESSEAMVRYVLHPGGQGNGAEVEYSRNSLRLPKFSTASNTFEMAELMK